MTGNVGHEVLIQELIWKPTFLSPFLHDFQKKKLAKEHFHVVHIFQKMYIYHWIEIGLPDRIKSCQKWFMGSEGFEIQEITSKLH